MLFLKKLKPTTSGQRHARILNSFFFPKQKRLKPFSLRVCYRSGKCSQQGQLLVYSKGRRKKRLFKRFPFCYFQGIVMQIERFNHRKFLCKCFSFQHKTFFYFPYSVGLGPGSLIRFADIKKAYTNTNLKKLGCVTPLSNVNSGRFINNLNAFSKQKPLIGCSSGSAISVLNRTSTSCLIRFPSGIFSRHPPQTLCLVGVPGITVLKQVVYGKAGRTVNLGKKPQVRGVAMNPVDHPHGGGEGKTSGGRPSVTPWGRPVRKGKKKIKQCRQ